MTPAEFVDIRLGKKLTQTQVARLIGVKRRTVENYEGGHRPIPMPAIILMRLLEYRGPAFLEPYVEEGTDAD